MRLAALLDANLGLATSLLGGTGEVSVAPLFCQFIISFCGRIEFNARETALNIKRAACVSASSIPSCSYPVCLCLPVCLCVALSARRPFAYFTALTVAVNGTVTVTLT